MASEKYSKVQYLDFFYNEIKSFLSPEKIDEIEKDLPEDFETKRKIGENENYICELIRKDSIEDFIVYVNKKNYPIESFIKPSLFETNLFLIKNNPTLIEYAAFYGSTQIFKYLYKNGAKLTSLLWIYSIHSQNPELIHYLIDNHIYPEDNSYIKCFEESIKCHLNEIANYIWRNYLDNIKIENSPNLISKCFKAYNFFFIEENMINQSSFIYLCKYDYLDLVEIILQNSNIDINQKIICNIINQKFQ